MDRMDRMKDKDRYERLAQELFARMQKQMPPPPNEHVSAVMRGEMAVIRRLSDEAEPISAGDISRDLHMSTPRIAAVLNSLQKKELIRRSADLADRRRVLVSLTERGKQAHEEKKNHIVENLHRLLEAMGETDAQEFVRLVGKAMDLTMKVCRPDGEEEGDEDGEK